MRTSKGNDGDNICVYNSSVSVSFTRFDWDVSVNWINAKNEVKYDKKNKK